MAMTAIASAGFWWIGLNNEEVEGTWVWSDGRSVTWNNWKRGEPTNDACLHNFAVLNGAIGKWGEFLRSFSEGCAEVRLKFICRIISGW